jgi:hypothetical protein
MTERIVELVELCFDVDEPNLCTSIYNLVYKDATYASLVNFAKALHTGLPKVLSMEEGKRSSIRVVIGKSIEAAIPKWEVGLHIPGPPNPGYTYSYGYRAAPSVPTPVDPRAPNVKTNRICELVDLSFALDDLGICTALFNELLRLPSGVDADTRFKEVFTPLIPQLRATLLKHGRAVTSEPFASFFKHSVSMYLARILGPRTPKTITLSLPTRTAGCNTCNECKQLKAFVNNGTPTLQFRAVQRTRTHLEQEIAKARIGDIVTTATVTNLGTPYTLVVSKRPEVISQLTWKENQSEAVKFVRSVADDAELKVVMGERYEQTLWAVHGQQVFTLTGNAVIAPGPVRNSSVATSSAPPTASTSGSSTAAHAASTPAGTKRKQREQPKNTIAVIDLT